MSTYTDPTIANKYEDYTESQNGKIERGYLFGMISKQLPTEKDIKVLDLGCGDGWLTQKLSEKYSDVIGCDVSESLIAAAKRRYNNNFVIADFSAPTKFSDNQFDLIVINMAAHCIQNQEFAFKEIHRILKSDGSVIITIPNPYYAYPVGVWKRGLKGFLLRSKPKLKLRPFCQYKIGSEFLWNDEFTSYFYPLSTQINNALAVGLELLYIEDAHSEKDSKNFDTNYQLYRFPISLILKYRKI
jgi:ubiquinone/menaquinone biosynthesis C-methylase UbiE